jgi:hypothetical protein
VLLYASGVNCQVGLDAAAILLDAEDSALAPEAFIAATVNV